MTKKSQKTTDAVEILEHELLGNDPEKLDRVEAYRTEFEIGQQIHDLRIQAGLTQQQLADLVGTKRTVITRLEDAEYEGHSLSMLRRIAKALGMRVQVRFVPRKRSAA